MATFVSLQGNRRTTIQDQVLCSSGSLSCTVERVDLLISPSEQVCCGWKLLNDCFPGKVEHGSSKLVHLFRPSDLFRFSLIAAMIFPCVLSETIWTKLDLDCTSFHCLIVFQEFYNDNNYNNLTLLIKLHVLWYNYMGIYPQGHSYYVYRKCCCSLGNIWLLYIAHIMLIIIIIIIIIISLTSIFFQDKSRVWTAASQQH